MPIERPVEVRVFRDLKIYELKPGPFTAYVLGYTLADGSFGSRKGLVPAKYIAGGIMAWTGNPTLAKRLKYVFSKCCDELSEQLNRRITFSHGDRIYEWKRKRYKLWWFYISSTPLARFRCAELADENLITLFRYFPQAIAGFLDGDGTVYLEKEGIKGYIQFRQSKIKLYNLEALAKALKWKGYVFTMNKGDEEVFLTPEGEYTSTIYELRIYGSADRARFIREIGKYCLHPNKRSKLEVMAKRLGITLKIPNEFTDVHMT